MTPKEKAEDLIDSFLREGYDIVMPNRLAKRCALIAVDEMIETLSNISWANQEGTSFAIKAKFWMDVKQEIEKL
jgi:hypothetical protein